MNNRFKVILPEIIKQNSFGFAEYSGNKVIFCEANNLKEVILKYPYAINIQKVDGKDSMNYS